MGGKEEKRQGSATVRAAPAHSGPLWPPPGPHLHALQRVQAALDARVELHHGSRNVVQASIGRGWRRNGRGQQCAGHVRLRGGAPPPRCGPRSLVRTQVLQRGAALRQVDAQHAAHVAQALGDDCRCGLHLGRGAVRTEQGENKGRVCGGMGWGRGESSTVRGGGRERAPTFQAPVLARRRAACAAVRRALFAPPRQQHAQTAF